MHGVRANRLEMFGRAKLFSEQGFAVLLFDFQAHGQSTGERITFGFLESRDARAAFDWLKLRSPKGGIGVLGMSLGGAAAILSEKPLEADAMVLEAVFGSLDDALGNRLKMYLGPFGRILAPLLRYQVKSRLGFDPNLLKPAVSVAKVHLPLLLIAGANDRHATLDEMNQIYHAANEPKELWIIPNATHVDFSKFAPDEYRRRVLEFFQTHLSR